MAKCPWRDGAIIQAFDFGTCTLYVTYPTMYIICMDALALLADPTRRRIVELLAQSELSAGDIAAHFDIARPGVSRHLRQLREGGLVSATKLGQRQIYRLETDQLIEIDRWLAPLRAFWTHRLDALETELARGSRRTVPTTYRQTTQQGAHDAAG